MTGGILPGKKEFAGFHGTIPAISSTIFCAETGNGRFQGKTV
jgi:hypothetical protein